MGMLDKLLLLYLSINLDLYGLLGFIFHETRPRGDQVLIVDMVFVIIPRGQDEYVTS